MTTASPRTVRLAADAALAHADGVLRQAHEALRAARKDHLRARFVRDAARADAHVAKTAVDAAWCKVTYAGSQLCYDPAVEAELVATGKVLGTANATLERADRDLDAALDVLRPAHEAAQEARVAVEKALERLVAAEMAEEAQWLAEQPVMVPGLPGTHDTTCPCRGCLDA